MYDEIKTNEPQVTESSYAERLDSKLGTLIEQLRTLTQQTNSLAGISANCGEDCDKKAPANYAEKVLYEIDDANDYASVCIQNLMRMGL